MRLFVRAAVILLVASAPVTVDGARAAVVDDDPLEQAREAAGRHSFTGVVSVSWQDGGTARSEDLYVRAVAGAIEVRGDATVMAEGDRARFVRHPGDGWDQLWSAALPASNRPPLFSKYELVAVGSLPVARRPTRAFEVREGPRARERLYLDDETGLLLRREQLDERGLVRRAVGFATFSLDPGTPAPRRPTKLEVRTARQVSPTGLPFPVPPRLAEGYVRLATYRDGGVGHALYSDGLYDLSVFEQRGRLQRRDLAGAARIAVGPRKAWSYTYAGGNILIWEAGRTVFTAVSDAPVDQLVHVARSLAPGGRSPSLLDRLRRASRAVVAPLA
ncbi:MAG TPA: sigma-E factor regulatory protein RseB domain-containing protein [Acidimicrobiales bacterium]|nr:sigma-E factor regulatory protein RseB domain-containing protein [Acidimicrobiales bacterium]